MRISLGSTTACPTPAPPMVYSGATSGGCPSGYTLQQMWVNSQGILVAPNSSGASLLPNPGTNNPGCPSYDCLNSSFQNPNQIQENSKLSQCGMEAALVLGAGVAGLIFLPGWTKLLSLAALPIAFGVSLCGEGL